MPTVRMLTSLADERHAFTEGATVQATPQEAEAWIRDGVAELVREDRAETPERQGGGPEFASARRTRRRNH